MIREIAAAFVAFGLTACVSPITREYAGRPMAEVIGHLGPPDNIFDGEDGQRSFQWSTTDVIVSSAPEGGYSEAYWTQNAAVGDGASSGRYCTITVVARWDAAGNGWIVTKAFGPFAPPQGSCGMRRAT